jgi:hypothetical protein
LPEILIDHVATPRLRILDLGNGFSRLRVGRGNADGNEQGKGKQSYSYVQRDSSRLGKGGVRLLSRSETPLQERLDPNTAQPLTKQGHRTS